MFVEYPVREEHVKAFINRPVGVVLTDGARHYGVVTGCEKGRLVLNGGNAARKKKHKGLKKADISAKTGKTKLAAPPQPPFVPAVPYGPYNPYSPAVPPGPRLALDLTTIGLLFAILP